MNLNNQDRPSQHVILNIAKDLRPRRATRLAKRSFATLRMTDKAWPILIVKLH